MDTPSPDPRRVFPLLPEAAAKNARECIAGVSLLTFCCLALLFYVSCVFILPLPRLEPVRFVFSPDHVTPVTLLFLFCVATVALYEYATSIEHVTAVEVTETLLVLHYRFLARKHAYPRLGQASLHPGDSPEKPDILVVCNAKGRGKATLRSDAFDFSTLLPELRKRMTVAVATPPATVNDGTSASDKEARELVRFTAVCLVIALVLAYFGSTGFRTGKAIHETGERTTGTVVSVSEATREDVRVRYAFSTGGDGKHVRESGWVRRDLFGDSVPGSPIEVAFLPGAPGNNRLPSERMDVEYIFFALTSAIAVLAAGGLVVAIRLLWRRRTRER